MPGKDATAEQLSAWRKEQGLPETAQAYADKLALPDGVVLGEADKPLVASFAERALARGVPQETFNDMVGWWYQQQAEQAQARVTRDNEYRFDSQQALMQLEGGDFKANCNARKAFYQEVPEEVRDLLYTARTADGRVLGDTPEFSAFIAKMARELNPAATLLPAGHGDMKGVSTRKAEIEGMMYVGGKQNPAYFGPSKAAQDLRKEYIDLTDAELKLQGKSTA